MEKWLIVAAAILGLVNVASADQRVHLHCAPKTTEIRVVILPTSKVARDDWREERNSIGTGWSFIAKSRSGTNLIGDIMSARGNVSAQNVSAPAGEWNCGTEADWENPASWTPCIKRSAQGLPVRLTVARLILSEQFFGESHVMIAL
jgi:hypothetical protein